MDIFWNHTMSDSEREMQRTSQTTSSSNGISITSMACARSAIPVPPPMDLKGDLALNWSIFREQYKDYEIATKLDNENPTSTSRYTEIGRGKSNTSNFQAFGYLFQSKRKYNTNSGCTRSLFCPIKKCHLRALHIPQHQPRRNGDDLSVCDQAL